ncbi:MAG TPA: hypothetical protein VN641_11280 [Urbifossiella sp.]|nr:hypothetical protein [Urbifossiella sp.]
MNDSQTVRAEIERILAAETDAVRLSNLLFTPGGLFSRLFVTPAEKKTVMDSPLFDAAQKRLSELQRRDVENLVKSSPPIVG